MPIDASIALGVKPVQIENPLDLATKAMTLKSLGLQNQINDQKVADDQSLRAAYRNSLTPDQNGTPTLDRNKFLSTLAQSNPLEAQKQRPVLEQQDLDHLTKQTAVAKQLIWGVNDQASWDLMRQKGLQLGLPNADKVPQQFDPQLLQQMKMSTLNAEEQVQSKQKDREFQLKQDENDVKRQDVAVKRQTQQNSKSAQATQQTMQLLESARGNPAASQAEKDIYSADKANSLANLYGDPNKLSQSQVNLLASEIGKIAQGGSPSMHELEGIQSNALYGRMSKFTGELLNHPTAANAAEWVKQYQDYANVLKSDAQKVIEDKYGRIIETKKGALSPDDYAALKTNYVDRFKSGSKKTPITLPNLEHASDDDVDKLYEQLGGK